MIAGLLGYSMHAILCLAYPCTPVMDAFETSSTFHIGAHDEFTQNLRPQSPICEGAIMAA